MMNKLDKCFYILENEKNQITSLLNMKNQSLNMKINGIKYLKMYKKIEIINNIFNYAYNFLNLLIANEIENKIQLRVKKSRTSLETSLKEIKTILLWISKKLEKITLTEIDKILLFDDKNNFEKRLDILSNKNISEKSKNIIKSLYPILINLIPEKN